MQEYFTLREDPSSPVIFTLPHAGAWSPAEVAHAFVRTPHFDDAERALLAQIAGEIGEAHTMLASHLHRGVVDLNRAPDKLRPDGRGGAVVRQVDDGGTPLYARPLPKRELRSRVARYHAPFHAALDALLLRRRAALGRAILLDVHAFSHNLGCDCVLSDVRGAACDAAASRRALQICRAFGLRARHNSPFDGGYIVRKTLHIHKVQAMQIEFCAGAPARKAAEVLRAIAKEFA